MACSKNARTPLFPFDLFRASLMTLVSTKYMSVTLELDRLLEVVGAIAGEVKKEADLTLRIETTVLIAASVLLGLLVLAVPLNR